MNKKYLSLLALFVVFIGGYCIGKYNNSQRYLFHNERNVIIDTYTGTIYFNGKSRELKDKKISQKNEVPVVEETVN